MEYNSDQLALLGIFGLTSSFVCDANIEKINSEVNEALPAVS